ncbi:MAG TPA: hypothetical protein VF068_02720 [Rubrobacter sp.]
MPVTSLSSVVIWSSLAVGATLATVTVNVPESDGAPPVSATVTVTV